MYAALLAGTGVLFLLTTKTRLPPGSATKTLIQRLAPLKNIRVWRFGLYYFFVFGGFVALAQWLVPYYVNAYATTVATAGLLTAVFSFPSGVIRALGGWMSDVWGARRVMYWVLGSSLACCLLLIVPQMNIRSPGNGIMARADGEVIDVSEYQIIVKATKTGREQAYPVKQKKGELVSEEEQHKQVLIWPRSTSWQEPVVTVGQSVQRKELIAKGVTQIFFQANIWVFTALCLVIGSVMGIGKAAVYKHIPDYFPTDVGVVGGIVGVLGGLGGFVCPVIFGYMLTATGLWTSCWMFFVVVVTICLVWMHIVVQRQLKQKVPQLEHQL